MSNFNYNVFLPKVIAISNSSINSIKDDFKAMFQCFDKLEEDLQNASARARDKSQKDKNAAKTLQSINEDDTESPKILDDKTKHSSESRTSTESSTERRGSKKRSKHEVEGMESPEQEKRQKRNASVKAQSIITKQVNVNLTQKLRRENSLEKGRRRRGKNDDKENAEPLPVIQVKQEKISIPPEPEPMDVSSPEASLAPDVAVKQESKDDLAMPPPAAPGPKSRKGIQKEKSEDSTDDEATGVRRTTSQRSRRTRKQTDTAPAQPASNRSVRASSRATKQADVEDNPAPSPVEPRPKRTRAKKVADTLNTDVQQESQSSVENATASPAEKPRPKRTRRAQKAAEKEAEKVPEPTQTEVISPKDERISQPEMKSPLLPVKSTKHKTNTEKTKLQEPTNVPQNNVTKILNNNYDSLDVEKIQTKNAKDHRHYEDDTAKYIETHAKTENQKTKNKTNNQDVKELNAKNQTNSSKKETISNEDVTDNVELDKMKVAEQLDATVTISKDLDQTVVLPNGVYNHAPITPKTVRAMNETVVLEHGRETIVLDKQHALMNSTVVLDKVDTKATNLTDDNSLITDDSDVAENTPPKKPPVMQPTSAVKEKVQQFEEMASRVTRTKTRAMAKKDEPPEEQTPPDKVSKVILSSETLTKMNSMIFNGKPPLVSKSASKPQANVVSSAKPLITASASKLSGINKAREADELRREREDARKKKEAILEAKREQQKKKREEKMAAAAAAREAAEKERRAAMEAAARDRMEKQAHADLGKLERLKEAERKRQETARKVAETEERRKAEEQARQQRLVDEQRRAEAMRRKQLEEAEALKKEAAMMQKDIERKQKEFMERQRMKQRMEGDKILTPLKSGSPYAPMEPVYMLDGFQYLNSDEDEDEDTPAIPTPAWSTSEMRRRQLSVQDRVAGALVGALFSVREHSPDLRDIFPNIERARLKRTSSAVWRTPPARLPVLRE